MTPLLHDPETMVGDAAHRVNVFAAESFADARGARRVLERHVRSGLFEYADVSAVPVRQIELLVSYQPGAAADWGTVAGELHRRWRQACATRIRVYWASRRTVQLLGGSMSGRMPSLDAVTHDLGVSAIALSLFGQSTVFREAWIPEERFTDVYGQAKPDAALAGQGGLANFLEFAGQYKQERLARLARVADAFDVPLQIYTIDPS